MSEGNIEKGFTPIRTVRLVSAVVAVAGMFCLLVQRILSIAMTMAQEILDLAFARYGNFTGRFAANNFAEDKKLLSMLNELKGLIPTVETALTLLLVLSVVLFVIALVGLALPRQTGHVLVALKLLKWQSEDAISQGDATSMSPRAKKILAVVSALAVLLVFGLFGARSCAEYFHEKTMQSVQEELNSAFSEYIQIQRAYFSKKKVVGTAAQLGFDDIPSGNYFAFKMGKSSLVAESIEEIDGCPAGSRWSVQASTSGFFQKELKFYSLMPKNRECLKIAPDLKNLVRQH